MADSKNTKTSGDDKVTTTAVPEAPTSKRLEPGAEYDKVVQSFYEGKMEPGHSIRFVTSGGETKAVVEKLG